MKDIWKDIDWDKFHFLRAEYLWLAIPMALVILLGILFYGDNATWKKHIAKHLQPYVIQRGTTWKVRLLHISLLVLFAIAFIGFLGPTWAEEQAPAKKVASKLVVALDLSQSMLTEDVSPNRLERAKFKIHDLLDANPRAETALLVFSGSTHTVVPFTTDYKIIKDNLDGLQPHMMPTKGTSFKLLFTKLDSLFVDNKAPGRVLVFTDDLADLSLTDVTNFVQNNNTSLNFYPMATQEGDHVPSFYNPKVALKDKGKVIVSKLNMDTQEALKQVDSVDVMEMTLDLQQKVGHFF